MRIARSTAPRCPLDDGLARCVVVCNCANLTAGRVACNIPGAVDIKAQQRRHRTHTNGHCLLHCPPANFEEARGIAHIDRPGGGQRRIFAKRVSGYIDDITGKFEITLGLEHPNDGKTCRHQRRLGIFG